MSPDHPQPPDPSPKFLIIFIIGAPGAGKGTLCTHLSATYNLWHISLGDALRAYTKETPQTPLSSLIKDKLANQGFLPFTDLRPFLSDAIKHAVDNHHAGLLVDGFPRTMQQSADFEDWASETGLWEGKVGMLLSLRVERETARERFLARARDVDDCGEKFERRFGEFERESLGVVRRFREAGMLVEVDVNGTKEENVEELMRRLEEIELWREVFAAEKGLGVGRG